MNNTLKAYLRGDGVAADTLLASEGESFPASSWLLLPQ